MDIRGQGCTNMSKKISIQNNRTFIVICILVQLCPLFLYIGYSHDSQIIDREVRECVDKYIDGKIEIYKNNIKDGGVVYSGIEKLIDDYKDDYFDLCSDAISLKYTKHHQLIIFIIFILYAVPSSFLSLKISFGAKLFTKDVCLSVSTILCCVAIVLINLLGMVLVWKFGIDHSF